MIGGGVSSEVVKCIEEWVPGDHDDESGFQDELQNYLDERLNESDNADMHVGLGGSSGEQFPVRVEHGKSRADVAVGEEVGIELKYNLTNNRVYELKGQIDTYRKEYPCVVAVACGLSDKGRWREIQNEYGGMGTVGMNQSEVHFIHKQSEHFGKDPSEVRDDSDGFLGEGGLL
ncbi:hypothetical protein [Haloarcula sp. 1CSR25-25]|uniref:hypothetical protein n=1 Tax=Haloarcula sp. 1CSR25-25 TaxID=2862545 RepID=UPI002895D1DC|nr:hypothetical protein [Haloarcula sp. 1CSR25-25]MDT3434259.1 hypothetical protein [Haloarcula sp. 1CSR25-25]